MRIGTYSLALLAAASLSIPASAAAQTPSGATPTFDIAFGSRVTVAPTAAVSPDGGATSAICYHFRAPSTAMVQATLSKNYKTGVLPPAFVLELAEGSSCGDPALIWRKADPCCLPARTIFGNRLVQPNVGLTEIVRFVPEEPADFVLRISWSNRLSPSVRYLRYVPMVPFGLKIGPKEGSWDDAKVTYQPLPSARSQRFAAMVLGETSTGAASTSSGTDGSAQALGTVFRDCEAACPEMVVLPAGSFLMGSTASEEGRNSDEGPAHQVTFARPFAMGKYEVTFDEWDACVAAGDCRRIAPPAWGGGRRPVVGVAWVDARAYVDWLARRTGQRYFLPSEAEWEYAARAGTTTPWNTGDAIVTDDANILNQFGQPVPVGGFPPNGFGLYDMHGNVAEWTLDCGEVGYFGVPFDGGAAVTPNCPLRVWRGGAFDNEPRLARSAFRMRASPATTRTGVGFRVARAL